MKAGSYFTVKNVGAFRVSGMTIGERKIPVSFAREFYSTARKGDVFKVLDPPSFWLPAKIVRVARRKTL